MHYCSQQRGYPGVPMAEYTTADVKREFLTAKSCAPNCTIGCVHRISYIDHWRAPQTRTVAPGGGGAGEDTDGGLKTAVDSVSEQWTVGQWTVCSGRKEPGADAPFIFWQSGCGIYQSMWGKVFLTVRWLSTVHVTAHCALSTVDCACDCPLLLNALGRAE